MPIGMLALANESFHATNSLKNESPNPLLHFHHHHH